MMTKKMGKKLAVISIFCLTSCFLMASSLFSQEIPKPGTVIDKTNYKKYAHLFMPEYLAGFENGWDGIRKLDISFNVVEPKPYSLPKALREMSEKNRGKYSIDKEGFIAGGYDYVGLPFPGVTTDDPDFVTKLMWNYTYKYVCDDNYAIAYVYQSKRGSLWNTEYHAPSVSFVNRLYAKPEGFYKTNLGLQKASRNMFTSPNFLKNQGMLLYRYLDPKLPDETFVYVPSLRRTLRGEAGQRSTPFGGGFISPDDIYVFDGRTQDFTYALVGEQKLLALADTKPNQKEYPDWKAKGDVPWFAEGWEVRDTYVIDITPKDPKYPQSKKRVYMDKETLNCYFGVSWDRAGNPWKIYRFDYVQIPTPDGDQFQIFGSSCGLDLQSQYVESTITTNKKVNRRNYMLDDFTPAALAGMGK